MDFPIFIPEGRRRQVAYHEAGHVAAFAFFYHNWGNIPYVTIKPNSECLGHVGGERLFLTQDLKSLPMPYRARLAYLEAICSLAGPVAEAKYSQTVFDFTEAALDEVFDKDGLIVANQDAPGTDLHKVKTFAEAVQRRSFPVRGLIHKWTNLSKELIDLPIVWDSMERFAGILLREGTVPAGDLLDSSFEAIFGASQRLPKWQRRSNRLGISCARFDRTFRQNRRRARQTPLIR